MPSRNRHAPKLKISPYRGTYLVTTRKKRNPKILKQFRRKSDAESYVKIKRKTGLVR